MSMVPFFMPSSRVPRIVSNDSQLSWCYRFIMKFLQFSSFLAALAGVTTADHLRAWDMAVPGVEIQRVWYGDGNARPSTNAPSD